MIENLWGLHAATVIPSEPSGAGRTTMDAGEFGPGMLGRGQLGSPDATETQTTPSRVWKTKFFFGIKMLGV